MFLMRLVLVFVLEHVSCSFSGGLGPDACFLCV